MMRTTIRRVLVCAGVCLAVLGAVQLSGSATPKAPGSTTPKAPGSTTPKAPGSTTPKAPGSATPKVPGRVAAPACGITWGSAEKSAGALRTPSLVRVVASQDTCWDRVTFEFAGPVDGYRVGYATEVPTEGQGLDLVPFTAGGEHLAVSLRAPATSLPATAGGHLGTALGDRTLRDVVFGGSFEGYTTFAIGVRARLPFQVSVLAGPGTRSRIAVDIAHQW